MGVMVNYPFTQWHHKSDIIGKHVLKSSHQTAMQAAAMFLQSIEQPQTATRTTIDKATADNIEKYRHILKSVAEAVLYCGRQCIGLRGDKEQTRCGGNPGNFFALMKLHANHDDILRQHTEHPTMKNATYISPQTQNEMIDVLGKRMIHTSLVDEIKSARLYTIMVDEVTSHNTELMPLCVMFVDCELNIREELLQICTLQRITGHHIATTIKQVLLSLGIAIEGCRGQGYDGAANEQRDGWRPGPYPTGCPKDRAQSLQWTLSEFGNCPLLQPAYSPKHHRQNEGKGDVFYEQSEKRAITQRSGNAGRAPHGTQTAAN